jgi:hypothetical protein
MNKVSQASSAVLMVRPARFGFNIQTAHTNLFQRKGKLELTQIHVNALKEFDEFVRILRANQIEVAVFDDTPNPHKPDAIFPNNWISFHHDGKVVVYPMNAPNRRSERRGDVLVDLQRVYDFDIKEVLDLSYYEQQNIFLEGTGSVVFDYVNKVGYASRSPRTNTLLFENVCDFLDYEPVILNAIDQKGNPVYHTNVWMAIGEGFAVVCLDCLTDKQMQKFLLQKLQGDGLEVIAINYDQLNNFAGNVLQVKNRQGKSFLVLSQTAFHSFTSQQIDRLTHYADLLPIDVNTIEEYGGGSVRCMLAGIYLPKLHLKAYQSL